MARIGAHVSIAGGILNAPANATSIGAECLQIFACSPRSWQRTSIAPDIAKEFTKIITVNDLSPVFIHALYLVNLVSDNPDLLDRSFNSLVADLLVADQINAQGVIVHLGSHQGRGFEKVKESLVVTITDIVNRVHHACFIIENSAGQQGKIGSLEEISWLIKAIDHPRVKICLDSAHLFAAGHDFVHHPDILSRDLNQLGLSDKIICLHLNDSKAGLGSGRDLHQNIGEGEIGSYGLASFLNIPELIGLPAILEVPGTNGFPDATNVARAKRLVA